MNAKTTYMGDLQIRRAHKRVEPLEEGSTKYSGRIRQGKTAKDHKSGAHANRFANRAKRDAWLKDNSKGRVSPVLDWPLGWPTPV